MKNGICETTKGMDLGTSALSGALSLRMKEKAMALHGWVDTCFLKATTSAIVELEGVHRQTSDPTAKAAWIWHFRPPNRDLRKYSHIQKDFRDPLQRPDGYLGGKCRTTYSQQWSALRNDIT